MSYTFAVLDEVKLDPEDLVALRGALRAERAFRLEQLAHLAGTWPSLDDLPADQQAREEVLAALAAAAQMVLTDVDAALSRMDAGEYGSCRLCDRPIPLACLRILPHARYCGPCHQLKGIGS
ncbi:TraR/DksA family transcriptional regulator [Kribbella sp. NBC_00889]|uniref:TraR/DksA family transcriptional regulator n=1 Tax=Kribbella sp. NBC_00889 TaxID=2975974 RepID=UPI003870E6B4|nr:hypothetical protein OG817_25255 [Kribbella sp. NBC_00889]